MHKALLCAAFAVASASASAGAAGCTDATCRVDDEVALLQRTVHEHNHQGFPDLDGIVNQVKDSVASAGDAVNDLLAKGVDKVGATINSTLAKLDTKATKYAAEVNASADDLRLGMASIVSKDLNVSLPTGMPSGKEYEKVVKDKVNKAVALFNSAAKSMEEAVGASKIVPPGLSDLAKSLNATLGAALDKCNSVLGSLKDVQAMVEDPKGKSLLQGDVDPQEAIAKVKETLKSSMDQAAGFASSVSESFGELKDTVLKKTKGKLSDAAQGHLAHTFDSVHKTAKHLAMSAQQAVTSMLGSVDQGIDTATAAAEKAAAPRAAGAGAQLGLVLAVAAAAVART